MHFHWQPRVVDIELGGEGDLVVLVWGVLHPYLGRGEGDHLAGGGDAGVEAAWGEGLVPGAGGDQLRVLKPVLVLKITERSTGVEHLSGVDQLSIPLPGPAGWSLGRLGAVDG